eukprot:gene7338-8158_t
MDILQSTVLHRKGKKWKSRWAVLKSSPVSDSAGPTLVLYKDANHVQTKQHKHIWPLWRYAGSHVFGKVEKAENVLMIFTETNTIVFAFENQVLLNEWQCSLQNEFGAETTFHVTVPAKQKLKAGEATLYICKSYFSIINDKSFRCIGRWSCSSLYRYASIEGDFVLETSSSGHTKGHIFRFQTKQSDDIVQTFDNIKETDDSEMKEQLKNQLNPGSGLLLDLEQSRRYTASAVDQNVFQRAFLRVSNRFRRTKRGQRERAATSDTHVNERRERLKQLNQSSSSTENRPFVQDSIDGSDVVADDKVKQNITQLPSEMESQQNTMAYKNRSNSHGEFKSQTRVKRKPEPINTKIPAAESLASSASNSPVKKIGSSMIPVNRAAKSSVGSVSGISNNSRAVSTSSEVFDEDVNDNKNSRQHKSSLPPIAPPRSPISLGIFEFPSKSNQDQREAAKDEREYLNKDDINEMAMRRGTEAESSAVSLRRKASEGTSLLEEIDKEIKRRTRDGESHDEDEVNGDGVSSVAVISPKVPYQSSVDHSDDNEDSGEAYVFLRTTNLGPQYSVVQIDTETTTIKASNDVNKKLSTSSNADPGVHSPSFEDKHETHSEYENLSTLQSNDALKSRRNSRRSSSKHLSDPIIIERFVNAQDQQQLQDNIVTGSLRELVHETNYVNVQGKDDDTSAQYVNMAAGGPAERKLRKGKKPKPLNLNRSPIHWDKYDDDDSIYHDVGPLISNGKSGSVEALKSTSDGSYENISARPSARDRAYVNMPSPSHKKPATILNYVLVNGRTGPKAASNSKVNKMGSSNSVNSSKGEYSMIDEKATSLLQKTREQHWQRREEDAQAQLNTPTRKMK